jgi:hypothetical protein
MNENDYLFIYLIFVYFLVKDNNSISYLLSLKKT